MSMWTTKCMLVVKRLGDVYKIIAYWVIIVSVWTDEVDNLYVKIEL
jgi:hypothetical protein